MTAIIGAQSTTLVESGANSQLLYGNTASNASVFLGGGVNEVSNASADSSMTVNLSGPGSVGSAASAIVNGALGQTTVNVGNGAMLDVLQGAVSVVAQTGTATVEVSAPTSDVSAVVTVSGVIGSTLLMFRVAAMPSLILAPAMSWCSIAGSAAARRCLAARPRSVASR